MRPLSCQLEDLSVASLGWIQPHSLRERERERERERDSERERHTLARTASGGFNHTNRKRERESLESIKKKLRQTLRLQAIKQSRLEQEYCAYKHFVNYRSMCFV